MNFIKWVFVATTMFPRDVRFSLDYLNTQGSIKYWRFRGFTIHQLFDKVATENPYKVAIRLDENAWTFNMLRDYSFQVANFFNSRGLQKGDVVAIFMENSPRYVGLWLGLSRLGVVSALVNTGVKLESLSHAIKVAESKAVIVDTNLLSVMQDVQASQFKLPDNIVLYTSGALGAKSLGNSINLDTEIEQASTRSIDPSITKQLDLSSRMLYIYTSGTTGLPKAAVMTYNRFVFLATSIHNFLSLTEDDVLYTPLPLYHASGGLLGTGQTLLFGNTMVVRKKFSASGYFPDCRKYGVTVGQYIGEMCSYMLAKPPTETDKKHKVRLMFGNGMRPQIWEDFKKRFGIEQIGEFYGSTEGNANVVNTYNKPGAVGFLPWFAYLFYPLTLIKYDPETNEPIRGKDGLCIEAETGSPGILIGGVKSSSSSSSFSGYSDKKATEKKLIHDVFKKGDVFFNSGDILKKDDYGYFYFVDRLGDTYRWKGENIAASQVEGFIIKHMPLPPSDVAVYGVKVPHNEGRAGMVAIAVHQKPSESNINMLDLKNVAETYMDPTMIPRFVRITEDLPRTSTQKIKKVDLQTQGFDVDAINGEKSPEDRDKIYFYAGKNEGYVPLTAQIYAQILKGEIPF